MTVLDRQRRDCAIAGKLCAHPRERLEAGEVWTFEDTGRWLW